MTRKQIEEFANAFARKWYNRPCSGCDESTLSSMLTEVLTLVANAATQAERERVNKRITNLLNS